jgi:hypothetical protein
MKLVDLILALVSAVVAHLIIELLGGRSLSEWLVRRAARRLPAEFAQRYEEEWLETLQTRPRLHGLCFAIGLLWVHASEARNGEPLRFTPVTPTAARVSVARQALIRWLSPPDRDCLTGALNRRYLMDTLERRIRRSGRPLSVLLLDVDRFKALNDQYGHMIGDEVLQCLTQLLHASIGRRGWIGRVAARSSPSCSQTPVWLRRLKWPKIFVQPAPKESW